MSPTNKQNKLRKKRKPTPNNIPYLDSNFLEQEKLQPTIMGPTIHLQ